MKALEYADDMVVFLAHPRELQALLRLLSARLNRDKTLAVSLSGDN